MKKAIGCLLFSMALCSAVLAQAEGWHQISQGRNFSKMVFADSLVGWAVSNMQDTSGGWYVMSNDCIFKTNDGGKNWTICRDYKGDLFSEINLDFLFCQNTIYCISNLVCFDGNPGGQKFEYSTDFGDVWQYYSMQSLYSDGAVRIALVDTQNIWASGDYIAKWNFNESQWDSLGQVSLLSRWNGGIQFCDTLNGFLAGENGYSGNYYFYKTVDGGYTWDSVSTLSYLTKFICRGVNNIWALCGGRVNYSSDTGKTWQEQNTGITNNFNCIFALNDTVLWAGADTGRFIYTKNGGSTWFKDSLSTTSRVNSIFFIGDSFGWAATSNGVLWGFGRAGLGVEGNIPEIAATTNKICLQASPNPFRQKTTIAFEPNSTGPMNVSIYSITGQLVKTLVDGFQEPGKHQISWNGRDSRNQPVSQGVYICQMKTTGHSTAKKIVLLR